MDPEKFKSLIVVLLNNLKRIETELVAYRMVFLAASQNEDAPDLSVALELATQRAAQVMDQKYGDIAERFQRIVDQDTFDQEASEFLRSWSPEGPAN